MGHKILFVINRMSYGGAGKIMAFLTNHLSAKHYDIHLLTYESNEIGQLLTQEVHHIDFHYSPPSIVALRRILQIVQVRKVISQIKPDIVVSFLAYPNITCVLASFGMRVPVIVSERGDPYSESGWFTPVKDFVYNFAEGYVFQTRGARDYYNKRIQAKAVVIPNPVAVEEIPPKWTEKKDDIIVTVGRLELKQKRQDILIHAFSKIAHNYPNLKLIIYGDGEDESQIKALISGCKLDRQIVLAGVTKNVYETIKKARMFVLSSDYEGIPNALIEAMAVGLPCISTDCSPGGAAELIRNMENGILVEPGCVDELADAMQFILENPDIAENMGVNAQKIAADLMPETIIGQWKSYIDEHIQSSNPHN